MATLALSVAGQLVGGLVGGPIGATVGRALGALAGSAVDSAIFGDHSVSQAQVGSDIRLQGSAEGGAVPRLYGWSRLTGNIIWATELEEMTRETTGAKGSAPVSEEQDICANFAVALCEGEVHHLGRIWADGQPLETEGLTLRFYRGSEEQTADSLIEAKQGVGAAPAYRGLCYIVFERLPLAAFGNRIPNISVELCRVVGDLEPAIRAITVIPGATEFGYDPTPRVRIVGPGSTENENTHLSSQVSDWTLSINELQALCPNLQHVSLVISWFGDDLRCGQCSIKPRVESADRTVDGTAWVVSGVGRGSAQVVSSHDGGPAFGGTPSDGAVLAAIADLKARGIAVTLYPMVLMDIASGNSLTSPYTRTSGQPAYPWRGRITCAPAPGQVGTPDRSAAVATQVDAFFGTAAAGSFSAAGNTVNFSGAGWGFRRMVLHYAKLAEMAGGVDAILIGSELRGLTTLRDASDSFPFVTGLATLAADVRAVVGSGTKLTYAADWSEFSGYQPADGSGDKFFHLDALWASSAIDAVGIDNYMPVSDWRDGSDNADAGLYDSPYDPNYLRANIAGAEGFDWYYASDADRLAGTRSSITDAAYGEPWIWRFKDIVGWWSNTHHNRIGGVRSAVATAWAAQSKPIWFTELGCGAVDKGANQPNVFGDPKSAESARPYFSSGAPDALMQRQVLRAHLGWWAPDAPGFVDASNPVSTVYGGRMLDAERIYLWTWDARPYPAFPTDLTAWSDGANYATGHWLTGRLGGMASDELLAAMARDYGVCLASVDAAQPLVFGVEIDGVVAGRDAMASMLAASGLAMRDRPEGLTLAKVSPQPAMAISADTLVAADGPLASRRRPDPSEAIGRVALSYTDRERDYLTGSVTAMRFAGGAVSGQGSNLVLDLSGARHVAEHLLLEASATRDTIDIAAPPSFAALEVGDALAIEGQSEGPFEITEIRDGAVRQISARSIAGTLTAAITNDRPLSQIAGPLARAIPVVAAAQLPPLAETPQQSRLALAVSAKPWPGDVVVTNEATGSAVARAVRTAMLGELVDDLAVGPIAVWDFGSVLTLTLYSGHLASADEPAVLAGSNRLAIETDAGAWEIVGFADAELVSPNTYRLTRLLRGLDGSSDAVGEASEGNRVMVLYDRVVTAPVPSEWLGDTLALKAYAGPQDFAGTELSFTPEIGPALPLSPVHLRATRGSGPDITLGWTRRSRADTDAWALADAPLDITPEAYRVTIFDGASPVRAIDTAIASASYSAAQQNADFGAAPSSFTFTVAQLSPVFGPGASAQGEFHD
jgi:hypothetical protein